jgi:CRISPR/Cas system CSM-associated protein Csm3 (group 7 of RAMP superfamily)
MSNKPSADARRQARYLITFKLRTVAPLHLGSGDDRPMSATEAKIATGVEELAGENKGERPWVAAIARAAAKQPGKPDEPGPPCIPGASLKGALRARALAHGHRHDAITFDILNRVFGRELPNAPAGEANTFPGSAEFGHATAQEQVSFSFETRIAIDRVTRTVADGKLFHVDVVPSGAQFQAKVVLPKASEAEAAALAALLRGCNEAQPLTLGAHGKAGWGRVVVDAVDAQVLTDEDRLRWWSDTTGQAKGWLDFASPVKLQEMQIAVSDNLIQVPLTIQFDGPFAVRDASYRKPKGDKHQNEPDIKPRQRGTRPLLPATGFLGALRSQAERILRTLGIETPQGHDAAKAPTGGAPTDLASLLFGCAGWRGLIGAADDFVGAAGSKRIEQNMIALCRVTGGVKDGAKFKMAGWESPTLTGKLTLDAARLKKQGDAAAALGLLHLTLLDLAGGDISFGLGRSKGWGWVKSNIDSTDQPWRKLIGQAIDVGGEQNAVEHCIQALLAKAPAPAPTPTPTQTATLSNGPSSPPITSNVKLPKLFRGPGQTGSEFHNPYHFLPFAKLITPAGGTADAPVAVQAKPLGHGHDKYEAKRFSGKLTVQLTTGTPLMIGAERRDAANANTPVVVDPFLYQGQRAIPGTSLRGMISALLEPMSGSGMRVISDEARDWMSRQYVAPRRGTVCIGGDTAVGTSLEIQECDAAGNPEFYWPIEHLAISQIAVDANPSHYVNDPRRRVQQGQLVFFKNEGEGEATSVCDIYLTNEWQERHHLPFGWRPDLALHPAEWMLGAVQANVQDDERAAAFAGKIAVGIARAESVRLDQPITLKELASPKPQWPSLRMRQIGTTKVAATKDIFRSNAPDFRFNGTKTYLHAQRGIGGVLPLDKNGTQTGSVKPWVSLRADGQLSFSDRQVKVEPISPGQSFQFEIKFENLDTNELGLLCASLRPSETFEHRLGMGRPIGLGSVKLEVGALHLEDRCRRYREGVVAAAQPPEDPVHLAKVAMKALHDRDRKLYIALLALGEPQHVTRPVHYPQVAAGHAHIEDENYRWWVKNDSLGTSAQQLGPIKALIKLPKVQ